jgi:hypothetical protein
MWLSVFLNLETAERFRALMNEYVEYFQIENPLPHAGRRKHIELMTRHVIDNFKPFERNSVPGDNFSRGEASPLYCAKRILYVKSQ